MIAHATATRSLFAAALAGECDKIIVRNSALARARCSDSAATFSLGMASATAQRATPDAGNTLHVNLARANQVNGERARLPGTPRRLSLRP